MNFDIPTLETDRLILRAPSLADFPALAAFYQDDRSKYVGGPMTPAQTWRMLATELGHWPLRGYGRFAVELKDTGTFIGNIGPWNPEGWPEAELGWDLMNGFEGHGYATEAALAARTFAYDTLGWTTAISLVADGNDGSAAVCTRLGCTQEADFTHDTFGNMRVFRHPAPQQQTGAAS